MTRASSPRQVVLRIIEQVVDQGATLNDALTRHAGTLREPRELAFAKALAFETLRWWPRLDYLLGRLLERPLRNKDRVVRYALLTGLAQIIVLRVPDHAAVSETVTLVRGLGRPWAAGLANAVLRRFGRERDAQLAALDRAPEAQYAHPGWLIEAIRQSWPRHWEDILDQNNRHPPMTIRVRGDVDTYMAELAARGLPSHRCEPAPAALVLEQAVDAMSLPGFEQGRVTVQDGAAQLAAALLDLAPGQRVLDACAAPGGKTAHILDSEPGLAEVLALDSSAPRLRRLEDNLQRLQLSAQLLAADAGDPDRWWDGRPFQRILLDAPCSATGIIRRHPDIKLLRSPRQLDELTATQSRLLRSLWPTLEPGGTLLYATCSILARENQDQIDAFLAATGDAVLEPLQPAWAGHPGPALSILPGEWDMDGFFYARLSKAGPVPADTAVPRPHN